MMSRITTWEERFSSRSSWQCYIWRNPQRYKNSSAYRKEVERTSSLRMRKRLLI